MKYGILNRFHTSGRAEGIVSMIGKVEVSGILTIFHISYLVLLEYQGS